DEAGNRVPEVHESGPSAGNQPLRGIDRDSIPMTVTGLPTRCASNTTEVSAPAMSAQRSSGGWSWSTKDRLTVRMSEGFLSSEFFSAEKISPTVVKSLPGCTCG